MNINIVVIKKSSNLQKFRQIFFDILSIYTLINFYNPTIHNLKYFGKNISKYT